MKNTFKVNRTSKTKFNIYSSLLLLPGWKIDLNTYFYVYRKCIDITLCMEFKSLEGKKRYDIEKGS